MPTPARGRVSGLQDAVAGPDAQGFAGSALDGRHHHHGVALDRELHANAIKAALQGLLGGAQLLRADVVAVRVEALQDVLEHIVHQRILLHGVHVLALDEVEHLGDLHRRIGRPAVKEREGGIGSGAGVAPDVQAGHQRTGQQQGLEGGKAGHAQRASNLWTITPPLRRSSSPEGSL